MAKSQEQIAALFGMGRSTITEHIRNVFKEGELEEPVVCREFRNTTAHGAIAGKTQENRMAKKEQEVQTLKDGIRILSRVIQKKRNIRIRIWKSWITEPYPIFI